MNYEYTAVNRLRQPHTYMYSKYRGTDFLFEYCEDRYSRLSSLRSVTSTPSNAFSKLAYCLLQELLGLEGTFPPVRINLSNGMPGAEIVHAAKPDSIWSKDGKIQTAQLLDSLLYRLLLDVPGALKTTEVTIWINLLVQRFEVSKKLFSEYLPGLRKGSGASEDIAIYCRFALLLALAYAHWNGLQYLSTLLKVNDMLLSLPEDAHSDCDYFSLALGVAVELYAVQRFAPILVE